MKSDPEHCKVCGVKMIKSEDIFIGPVNLDVLDFGGICYKCIRELEEHIIEEAGM